MDTNIENQQVANQKVPVTPVVADVVEETVAPVADTSGVANVFNYGSYKSLLGLDPSDKLGWTKQEKPSDRTGEYYYQAKYSNPETGIQYNIGAPESIYLAIAEKGNNYDFMLKSKTGVYPTSGDEYVKHTFGVPAKADNFM